MDELVLISYGETTAAAAWHDFLHVLVYVSCLDTTPHSQQARKHVMNYQLGVFQLVSSDTIGKSQMVVSSLSLTCKGVATIVAIVKPSSVWFEWRHTLSP
jgi:hypothetical protein